MSAGLFDVGADFGNWGSKIATAGKSVVIRNVAVPYDGGDDAVRELGLFGAGAAEASQRGEPMTESARIVINGQQWVVGELAYQLSVQSRQRTTYSRYGTDEWIALVAASFARICEGQSAALGLTFSLPVSQIRLGKHREVKDLLVGEWQIEYEDKQLTYEVREDMIDVVPEGFGSLAYLCLAEGGKRFDDRALAESRVVLLDFGGFTLDFATYDQLNLGNYNESITSGLINVRNEVNRLLKRRYDRGEVPARILDEVIRTKTYRHAGGTPDDVSDIVDGALMNLMGDALRVWQEELGNGADYDVVIITGGGGPVIGSLLEPQLGHGDVRVIREGYAHLANALGSLRHRQFKREYS